MAKEGDSLLDKLAKAAKRIYPGGDASSTSRNEDTSTLTPKRPPLDERAAEVYDRTYAQYVGGRGGQDDARKKAYAATVQFYREQGAGERTAAQRAGKIKEGSGRRRVQGIVPVLISILILFAAYLISNWSLYEKTITAFFLAR